MIKRKLGKIMFAWNESALKGKGWWYVLGEGDSFSRAASRKEASNLGFPKESEKPPKDAPIEKPLEDMESEEDNDTSMGKANDKYYYDVNPVTGKPMRRRIRTGSQYERSDITSSKSLGLLASERMMDGQGLMGSLTGALGDKVKAKGMGIKKTFDPMNILSKIPGIGKIAATAYGMKRGRSAEDISYFTGVQPTQRMDDSITPESTKEGTSKKATKLRKSDTNVLNKIHDMLAEKFEEDKVIRDTENSFKEEEKSETERRHQELIDAILQGIRPEEKTKEEKEKKGGILDTIRNMLGGVLSGLGTFLGLSKFKNIIGGAKSIGSKVISGAKSIGSKVIGGAKSIGSKASSFGSKAIKGVASAGKSLVKGGASAVTKTASIAGKAMTGMKSALGFGSDAEKAGSALAKSTKIAGTATKAAGVGGKILSGGKKLLGFFKGIPGLGLIAAGADMIMRIGEVNDDLENGVITQAEYKKEMTKAVGDGLMGGLLPVVGGVAGSLLGGPVGAVIGGLTGVGATLLGADKAGGYVAGKLYDFFVDDKKDSSKVKPKSKPTASPVATSSPPSLQEQVEPKTPESVYNKLLNEASPEQKKDPAFLQSLREEAAMTASIPTAIPQVTSSPLGVRATSSTLQNKELKDETLGKSSPVIVNKTTNIMGGGGSSGSTISASVRNDDPILTRLQFQSMRPV
jgi:hypothetical protein